MNNDLQYINVEGSPGYARDKDTGIVINTNSSEIENAKKRKLLSKQKDEELTNIKEDVKNLKSGLNEIKSLLTKMVEKYG